MNIFVQALDWTLLHFLWQGLLIAGATALALAVLRNARAEARHGKVEGSSIARSSVLFVRLADSIV